MANSDLTGDLTGTAMDLARQLTALADAGEAHARDHTSMAFYELIRDCARRIGYAARIEEDRHRGAGSGKGSRGLVHEESPIAQGTFSGLLSAEGARGDFDREKRLNAS